MKSVMALEAIWWPLRPFRGSQSYTKAIRGHFYCKNALFHWPFWCLGTTGNRSKIILGKFLEPAGHVIYFLETGLDGKGSKLLLKVGHFGQFLGGRQGTWMSTDLAQIWNHEAFRVPLHLQSPLLMFQSYGRTTWPIFQNWSNLAVIPVCGPTLVLGPF